MCFARFILFTIVALKFSSIVRGEDTLIPALDTDPQVSAKGCSLRANVTFSGGSPFPVKINCAALNRTDTGQRNFSYSNELNDLFLNRFKNIQNISMDGRDSDLQSFALEHFPDANMSLEIATFRYFEIEVIRKDVLQGISVVKKLSFENNTFGSIEAGAFKFTPFVSAIKFQQNHLKKIGLGVFDTLTKLQSLALYEEDLTIESEEFFVEMSCENLSIAIKTMPSGVFGKLPRPLIRLQVNNMLFDEIEVHNPGNMSTLMIFDNKIPNLTVIDSHILTYVNLSNNSLENFKCVNCTQVEILSLSSNHLHELHSEQIVGMEQLKFVYLQKNRLKTLSMDIFQSALPVALKIDLTNNSLHSINIPSNFTPNPNLKVVLNLNPWDCHWILNTNGQRPDIFRVFQYEKFTSKINVNGLQCMMYPSSLNGLSTENKELEKAAEEAAELENADVELERTIRRHILHGLIILTGIAAVITVILYVWTKCRNMVRLPFYESLKRSHWSPERFDVRPQTPVDDRPDYEIPLEFFNSNTNLEHVELLDTIGSLEPIDLPTPDSGVIYEEIPE